MLGWILAPLLLAVLSSGTVYPHADSQAKESVFIQAPGNLKCGPFTWFEAIAMDYVFRLKDMID